MSKPIRYVFTISHPMQYIVALEYCYAHKLPKEACAVLILNKPYPVQIEQLQASVNEEDWGYLSYISYPNYWVEPGKKHTFFSWIKVSFSKIYSIWSLHDSIKNFVRQYCATPLKAVAIGNYMSRPHRHFLAYAQTALGIEEVIILDEGTSIPHVVVPIRNDVNVKLPVRSSKRFTKRDWAGKLLNFFTPLTYNHPPKVSFFTIFKSIEPPEHDRLIANNFSRIKENIKNFRTNNELWFIGTCFVEHKITSAENYLKLMRTVKEAYPNQQIVYFPHRYESSENLKNIAALGITILRPNMAIEPWMIAHKKRPKHMAAIASTAVSNISYIFGGEIPFTLFRPDLAFFNNEQKYHLWHKLIQDMAKENRQNITILEFKTLS